jgi:hypothetical protein
MHCTENLKQVFPEMKLLGLILYFYILVSVSDVNIPTFGRLILLLCVCGPIVRIYKSLTET